MISMFNKRRLTMATALLGLAAGTGHAQQSLLDIYQLALDSDPTLRQQEAVLMRDLESKSLARSAVLPSLQISGSQQHSYSKDPDPPTDFQTGQPSLIIASRESESDTQNLSLSLNQTLFDWAGFVGMRQANKMQARAETNYEVAKQDLATRVATAYFTVLGAEDTLASEVAAREALARQLEQAQRRFEVGLIAITDVQESQAGHDAAVAAVIDAERNLATAQELLREIIGVSVTDLAPPRDDMPLESPDPANAEQWVNNALDSNLELAASRISADIAEDDIAIQRSVRFPRLSLSGSYSDRGTDALQTNNYFPGVPPALIRPDTPTMNTSQGYNYGITLTIPIYSGGVNGARIRQSVYSYRATIQQTEAVARATEREARDAYLGVRSEISRVQALQQALQSARTALAATEAGFEVGTRTTVDVLTFQDSLRRAQTNYARSRYDYILEVLRLQRAVGNLGPDVLAEVDGWLQ